MVNPADTGTADDMETNASTFMIEMQETARSEFWIVSLSLCVDIYNVLMVTTQPSQRLTSVFLVSHRVRIQVLWFSLHLLLLNNCC